MIALAMACFSSLGPSNSTPLADFLLLEGTGVIGSDGASGRRDRVSVDRFDG